MNTILLNFIFLKFDSLAQLLLQSEYCLLLSSTLLLCSLEMLNEIGIGGKVVKRVCESFGNG